MEEQLKTALRRKQPSADFTKRVMERVVERRPSSRGVGGRGRPPLHWRAVAAALTLTAILGGWTAHAIAQRRAGEHAKDEVLLALRIAGSKVRYAQSQVHDIGRK